MKRILLLGTGGTIACKRTEDGLKPVITSGEILSYVPGSRDFCQIESIQAFNIDSTNIQPHHWLTITRSALLPHSAFPETHCHNRSPEAH